jgi:hypothetical protein
MVYTLQYCYSEGKAVRLEADHEACIVHFAEVVAK